jgi:hypothetical protein
MIFRINVIITLNNVKRLVCGVAAHSFCCEVGTGFVNVIYINAMLQSLLQLF